MSLQCFECYITADSTGTWHSNYTLFLPDQIRPINLAHSFDCINTCAFLCFGEQGGEENLYFESLRTVRGF